MKTKAITALLACASFVVLWGGAICPAAEPPTSPDKPVQEPRTIRTNFVADAQLTVAELKQALSLAKQSGISDVAEVRTFHYGIWAGKGILVKGVERVDGRNVSFDRVWIHKAGWDQHQPNKEGLKRDGDLWFDANGRGTTLMRSYEFNQQQLVSIEIGNGVDLALADKVVPLIAAKNVVFGNFEDEVSRTLAKAKPEAIYKGEVGNQYELRFSGPFMHRSLRFSLENSQVVIYGVSDIVH